MDWTNENGEVMRQYDLHYENGDWLATVYLRDSGQVYIASDYGDWAWRFYIGENTDIRSFVLKLSLDYLASKVRQSWGFLSSTSKMRKEAKAFADNILPTLQKAIHKELSAEDDKEKRNTE